MTHTELSLLIRAGDSWYVNDEVGEEAGWLEAEVVSEEDKLIPPLKGWQYYDGSEWESDPTLECSREVSTTCREVVVNLYGGAKEKFPYCAGRYLPVKGKMNRGRWVGSCQLINNTHLQNITIVIDATLSYNMC